MLLFWICLAVCGFAAVVEVDACLRSTRRRASLKLVHAGIRALSTESDAETRFEEKRLDPARLTDRAIMIWGGKIDEW